MQALDFQFFLQVFLWNVGLLWVQVEVKRFYHIFFMLISKCIGLNPVNFHLHGILIVGKMILSQVRNAIHLESDFCHLKTVI